MQVSITNTRELDRTGLPVESFDLVVESDSFDAPEAVAEMYLKLNEKLAKKIKGGE